MSAFTQIFFDSMLTNWAHLRAAPALHAVEMGCNGAATSKA
jgi:hypothetical protein